MSQDGSNQLGGQRAGLAQVALSSSRGYQGQSEQHEPSDDGDERFHGQRDAEENEKQQHPESAAGSTYGPSTVLATSSSDGLRPPPRIRSRCA